MSDSERPKVTDEIALELTKLYFEEQNEKNVKDWKQVATVFLGFRYALVKSINGDTHIGTGSAKRAYEHFENPMTESPEKA